MTYIIPISAIQGAVHLLQLTPQPNISQWYWNHMISSTAVDWFYMWIIQLDAWSNYCSNIRRFDQCLLWEI
jgi:hypothetical protein